MPDRIAADIFPPGDFILDELEARCWSLDDLIEVLGCPSQLVNEIISGRRAITPEIARRLAAAFGTSPELWLNLDAAYHHGKRDRTNCSVRTASNEP